MTDKRPEITASDLPRITSALRIFKKILFNSWGGMYATVNTGLPMFGPVVFSCILSEGHIKVYRSDENGSDDGIWSGYLNELGFNGIDDIKSLAELTSRIKAKLREETAVALDE